MAQATSTPATPDGDWWADLDGEILGQLDDKPALCAGDVARALGVSEDAANSFLAHLALAGKVRIQIVQRVRPTHHG